MDHETELFWLAGLLEGEGSFLAGPPSSPSCPRIQLPMTDRDVVAHAARLFDRPVWRSDRGRDIGYKPVFLTSIKGAAAVHLMAALRTIMGVRRQAQIDHALERPHNRRIRWYRHASACAVAACARAVRTRGLCKAHYQSWWKSTKRGHLPRHSPIDAPLPAAVGAVGTLAMPTAGTHSALGWLAGLLEGEGTFEANLQHALRYPRIALRMCDEDVVQRASALIGSRSVWREEPREDRWRATYGTATMGAHAAELMSALLPYMGRRRSSEISMALGAYGPIRLVVTRLTCTAPGCGAPHDARGLCHRHHMQWWRDVRAARAPRVMALDSSDLGRPISP